MNTDPTDAPDDQGVGADNASAAMDQQLRGDVSSWRAARSGPAAPVSAGPALPEITAPKAKPALRTKAAKPKPPAVQPSDGKKKPFGMGYDGMSQADYITYLISRGAR